MFRYLVRRLLWAILLFIVITFVTFVIFFIAPNNPARGYCGGENAKAQCLEAATEKYHFDDPVPLQYFNFLKRLVIDRSLGQSTFTRPGRERGNRAGRPGDRIARLRRRRAVDDDRPRGRGLLGPQATFAARPSRDGVRPHRRVRAPGVDRPDLLLFLRLQTGDHADRELCELLRRSRRLGLARRPVAVVLPPDPAVVHLRHSVRRAVRAHDPRERDGDP